MLEFTLRSVMKVSNNLFCPEQSASPELNQAILGVHVVYTWRRNDFSCARVHLNRGWQSVIWCAMSNCENLSFLLQIRAAWQIIVNLSQMLRQISFHFVSYFSFAFRKDLLFLPASLGLHYHSTSAITIQIFLCIIKDLHHSALCFSPTFNHSCDVT